MPLCSSVPRIASAMLISPASTPRRAVTGELNHLSDNTNSAVAIRYVISRIVSLANMGLRFPRPAGLEHLQHPVRDQEAPDDVAGGRHDRDRSQYFCQQALTFARQNDCAHHRDRVQRI